MREIPKPPLMLITDRKLARGNLLTIVEETFNAGCRWLMIREKDLTRDELDKFITPFKNLAEKYSSKIVLNNYPELVVKHDLHGIHLPWGTSVKTAREIIGEDRVIGVSTHSVEEAVQAEREEADYITLSPVFKSLSKKTYDKTIGLRTLHEAAKRVRIPIIALGGITPDNALECIKHGAAGLAVVGAILLSDNPGETTRNFLEKLSSSNL